MIKNILWVFVFIFIAVGLYSIIKKKSQLYTAISFFLSIITFFISYFFPFSDTKNITLETSESTLQTYSTFQQSQTHIDDAVETKMIEDSSSKITEESEESSVEESTLSFDNVIKGDCDLKGSFRNGLTERYVWYPKYNSSYGLKFYISDVNLSYYVKIKNDKGEMLYEYCIEDDGVTEHPSLDKDSEYILLVEANKGRPEYKIEIRYPDNDDY